MHPLAALERLGGVATRAQLLKVCARADVDRLLASGDVEAVAHGRYVHPLVGEAARESHRLTAVASHQSAALAHGWAVKGEPAAIHLTVKRSRSLKSERDTRLQVHYADLAPDDLDGWHTSRERTMLDCLRTGSFADALAIADSALRSGESPAWLQRIAASARGSGAKQARRVGRHADARAANPFESALRAITIDLGHDFEPQVPLWAEGFLGRPDLVNRELRIVLEADSFEWHGSRRALTSDARRYNCFVVNGWLVLRFSWEDVMLFPDQVAATIQALVDQPARCTCGCHVAA